MAERRIKRTLTEDDIKAITDALYSDENHICRFESIRTNDMQEAVKFYQHFNKMMEESGSVIRKTFLVLGIGGLVTLVGMGLIVKVKSMMGP